MKQFLYSVLFLLLFIVILCFPSTTFVGASQGLLLWFHTILPTLLPFMILSNLLIYSNAVSIISRILKPFIPRFFHVSEHACYAILIGFLCGYPMGAKVIADLIHTKRITKEEGCYLLSFCNNTSPMFILGFVVMQIFQDQTLVFATLLIFIISPIICSFMFRKFYSFPTVTNHTYTTTGTISFHFKMFDQAIMNGFESITRIGGYIILFSILFSLGGKLPFHWFLPSLEVSNGITYLSKMHLSFPAMYTVILAFTSFGGFCAIAQTNAMIQDTDIPLFPYIIQKLITALVTSLLAFIYITFIHR